MRTKIKNEFLSVSLTGNIVRLATEYQIATLNMFGENNNIAKTEIRTISHVGLKLH